MRKVVLMIILIISAASMSAQKDYDYRMEIGGGLGLTGYLGDFNGNITNLPYDMDFIYDKNIYFSYSLEQGKYRALYILKPKQYKMWDLNNQIEANATPFLIVGIQLNKPGYKIIKMPFVTFVEP
jgi:hypothetical protein